MERVEFFWGNVFEPGLPHAGFKEPDTPERPLAFEHLEKEIRRGRDDIALLR